MESLPCEGCKGMCCGPVPVTEQELKRIRKTIKSMSPKRRAELQNQSCFFGTCMFYDADRDQCGIYSARPEICRLFGYHKGLVCYRKPELATKEIRGIGEKAIGVLSMDFSWRDFT